MNIRFKLLECDFAAFGYNDVEFKEAVIPDEDHVIIFLGRELVGSIGGFDRISARVKPLQLLKYSTL